MDWKDIAGVVGKAAPLLGTVLAGPAGGAIGAIVASALGVENTPDAVAQAVANDPEAAVRLREIESAERVRLQELALEQSKAELADIASARTRDVALVQAGHTNTRANWMVAMDAIGLIACLVVLAVFNTTLPEGVATLISTIASIFGLCLRDAHQFEFGSSRGSASKDVTIQRLTTGS
jgi:hypothetical protein